MRPAPPRKLERLIGLFIPPACREEVLGDLHERYTGRARYLADALCAVPLVIVSRIRRTTDAQVLLMEAFVLMLSLLGAARYNDATFLTKQWGLLRLAIPAAMALLGLMLDDAYARPGARWPLKAVRAPAFGLGMACLLQAVLSMGNPELTLPRWILWCGLGLGILLASTVRLLFPPLADRPQGAHGPAFWLQQAVEPMQISANAIRVVKGVGTVTVLALVWASVDSAIGRKVLMLALAVLAVYEICKRVN
jgi:hypothetical protein